MFLCSIERRWMVKFLPHFWIFSCLYIKNFLVCHSYSIAAPVEVTCFFMLQLLRLCFDTPKDEIKCYVTCTLCPSCSVKLFLRVYFNMAGLLLTNLCFEHLQNNRKVRIVSSFHLQCLSICLNNIFFCWWKWWRAKLSNHNNILLCIMR